LLRVATSKLEKQHMSQFIVDPWKDTNARLHALAARYKELCHVIADNVDKLAFNPEPNDTFEGEFPRPGSVAALLTIAPDYANISRGEMFDGLRAEISIPGAGCICGTIPVLPAEPCFLYADIDLGPDGEEIWGFDLKTCYDRLASYAECDGSRNMFLISRADMSLAV
jgi:hypothetical protein